MSNINTKEIGRDACFVNAKNIRRPPVHPGVIFAEEIMPALRERATVSEIARLLGVSRATLHRLMAGDIAMTPEMRGRIGKPVGNRPGLRPRRPAKAEQWEP